MRIERTIPFWAAVVTAAILFPVPVRAQGNMTMLEPGYSCVYISEIFSKQGELGVPGAGGVGDSCIWLGTFDGLARMCNPLADPEICDPDLTFPVGVAFSAGGSFGSYTYITDYGVGGVHRSIGCSPATLFASIVDPGACVFPPAGSPYGDFLYTCEAFNGPIYRVSSAGVVTPWLAMKTAYIKFGPGGAWGTGMYATEYSQTPLQSRIAKVSTAGALTTLTSGFFFPEGFDWGFDNDMFATDPSFGLVKRIHSDGSASDFATLPGAADVAWRPGEQALYVVSNQGGLYRVKFTGTAGVEDAPRAAGAFRVTPNPAYGPCTLRFTSRAAGMAHVEILDVAGRLVRRVSDAWRTAGEHSVAWDGRDESGARARPGSYFARVRVARDTYSAPVTVVN